MGEIRPYFYVDGGKPTKRKAEDTKKGITDKTIPEQLCAGGQISLRAGRI